MQVLVFAPFFPPDPTGSAIFARDQVLSLLQQGHQVRLVTNEPSNEYRNSGQDELDASGLSWLRLRCVRIGFGPASWYYKIPFSIVGLFQPKTLKFLCSQRADFAIVHSTLFDLTVFALIWCKVMRIPVILVAHTALWHENTFMRFLLQLFGKLILRPLVSSGRVQVVCVDKWTNENALKTFAKNCITKVIPVSVGVHNVVNGDQRAVRNLLSLERRPLVLSLGHVVAVRNRHNLVRSLPYLVTEFPNLQVVIVGMVSDNSFLTIAKDLGVTKHLVLTGKVPHSQIKDLLSAADIETHDLDGRGLGITSVEAMAASVPIVAWVAKDNYPGIDLESFGPLGFVESSEPSEIASMISRLLKDQDFASVVRNTQLRLVEEVFSATSITEQYLSIARLLSNRQ